METGLYYHGARSRDPRVGGWYSVDPILDSYLDGKPAGGVYNSVNLNLYHYAGNNPTKYIDPDGNHPVLIAFGVGALVGASFELVNQLSSGGKTDWKKVGIATFAGGVSGMTGVGLSGMLGKSIVSSAISSSAGGAVGAAINKGGSNLYYGKNLSSGLSKSIAIGGIGGFFGGAIGGAMMRTIPAWHIRGYNTSDKLLSNYFNVQNIANNTKNSIVPAMFSSELIANGISTSIDSSIGSEVDRNSADNLDPASFSKGENRPPGYYPLDVLDPQTGNVKEGYWIKQEPYDIYPPNEGEK